MDVALSELLPLLVAESERRFDYKFRDDWCWGFGCRSIADSDTPSFHSYGGGRAVDVNAPANTRGTEGNIPNLMGDLWEQYGFTWGGRWAYSDPMHFEFRGTRLHAKRMTRRAKRRSARGERL